MGRRKKGSWLFLFVYLGFFFQAPFLHSQEQGCDPSDLKALGWFLEGLASKMTLGWSMNTSASSPNCCNWVGVSCDSFSSSNSSRRVVGLDLSNKRLGGVISDSLADLDHLQSLYLSNNSFRGEVPARLFQLRWLEYLDLSSNELSGAVPADSYLPSILVFNVSGNMFSGNHPILSGSKNLTLFDVGYNMFSGPINASVCSNSSSRIEALYFSRNQFSGDFPAGFGNCSSLQELLLDSNKISGRLPSDLFRLSSLTRLYLQNNQLSGTVSPSFGNLSNLVRLDISVNGFSGLIPNVFGTLKELEYFSAWSNSFMGPLPPSLSELSVLQVLNLRSNSLGGDIDLDFTMMKRLSSLDLGSNKFTGSIPRELSSCLELETLNLARNRLVGQIPDSFKNLKALSYLSLSNNSFTNISLALGILQHCPDLTALVLTLNFRRESMPSSGFPGFQNLKLLVIPYCGLSGSIPPWLVDFSKLQLLDLSWNQLEGTIPSWLGNFESLFYLDLSNNSLTGEIPQSLTQMKSLIFGIVLQPGSSEPDFPFFSKKNVSSKGLQYNQLSSFPPSLVLSHNMLVGSISPEFKNLRKLHVLDLRRNNLTGTIPEELSSMASLEILDLSYNDLTGSIPWSLTKLNFLSSFSVAYNELVGPIPLGGQFSTFPNSSFQGNKGLCGERFPPCAVDIVPQSRSGKGNGEIIGVAVGIGSGTALLLFFVYLVVSRARSTRVSDREKGEAKSKESAEYFGAGLVVLFRHMDSKELTVDDILKSTNSFDQANIIGCGGFGLVYKATLPDGRKVAIKRLSGDYGQMEREFRAEVEALSRAQHPNLVLLQGYCRIGIDRLLIYSYMENGSLDYWLHEKLDGGSVLSWETRLKIAQGAAKGLAYLHQSCQPHILHRDIKTSNILLDENFEAHLADFGLARLILPYDTHVTTDLVGTLGYIPPEYGQSSVATFKGDVYSFGVVLLELLTGKRPVDMCKPKRCRDLISWVFQMKKEKRETEIFDPFIYDKEHDKQLLQVLEIACLCLSESPKMRPLTEKIVPWLESIKLGEQLTK